MADPTPITIQEVPRVDKSSTVKKLDIDKDLREVDTLLTPLDEPELECLFRDLGLSDARVRNKRSSDRNVYATSLIRYWIIENDDVGKKGGATWKTLKECLNRLGHRGIAEKIENAAGTKDDSVSDTNFNDPSDISVSFCCKFRKARVKWKYEGDASKFRVLLNGKDAKEVDKTKREVLFTCLRPTTSYRIKVIAVHKDDEETSHEINYKYCNGRRICRYIMRIILLNIILLITALPCYKLYTYHMGNDGATYYILGGAAVKCGEGNSHKHSGISLEQEDDSLQGIFNATLVSQDDLKLYSKQAETFLTPCNYTTCGQYTLLNGWDRYLWKESEISGSVCVQNQNNIEATASLHIFTDDKAKDQYQEGEPPTHCILVEMANIKPGATHCFIEWGKYKPYIVTKSSYYFFVMYISKHNMNFTAEITLLQNYVNITDYKNPHYFKYNKDTYFKFPNGYSDPTNYITICQAPSYLQHLNRNYSAESVHIRSWKSPYHDIFVISIVAICVCFVTAIICILCSCFKFSSPCYYCKDQITNCKGYDHHR